MKDFKSVKEVMDTVVGKIVIAIMSILIGAAIIPELLNARNDFAVMMGIFMIITIIICAVLYWKKVLNWLGFDTTEE